MDIYAELRALAALTLSPSPNSTSTELPPEPPSQNTQCSHARSLLLTALHETPDRRRRFPEPQTQDALQFENDECDLSLLTRAGVEFRIHSHVLAGGPKFLEEQLYLNALSSIKLPEECHPILVDRLVSFLYTKDYNTPPLRLPLLSDHPDCGLSNAFYVPECRASVADVTALTDAPRHIFHFHMYALGEQLQYEALMEAAQSKLWEILYNLMRRPTAIAAMSLLQDCVDSCFDRAGHKARVCRDENGTLKETVVVAVIAHEVKDWDAAHRNNLVACFPEPRYKAFWTLYEVLEIENSDLLAPVAKMRQAKLRAEGLKRVADRRATPTDTTNNVQDRRKKKETRRTRAQAAQEALNMNAHVFGSIDMAKASADLARARYAYPAQIRDFSALRYGLDTGPNLHTAFPKEWFPSTGIPGLVQHHGRTDVGGLIGGTYKSMLARDIQDVELEMRDRMMRMCINDEVRNCQDDVAEMRDGMMRMRIDDEFRD